MSVSHIAFDLDGVLFTSETFIADSYRVAVEKSGLDLEIPAKEKVIKQFGKPGKEIIKNLFGKLGDNDVNILRKYLIEDIVDNIRSGGGTLFGNIENVLQTLSVNYTLALCSNGNEDYLNAVMEYKNIRSFFLPLLTLSNTGCTNKTDLLKEYITRENCENKNWIMVGDRLTDLEAAINNRCHFIGCLWGFADPGEMQEADILLSKPEDIPEAVTKLSTA